MDREDYFLDLLEGDQNDPNVQYEIGRCYLQGDGVEPDGTQAEAWLRRAAAQGQQDAIALLTPQAEKETPPETVHEGNLMDWCVAAEGGDPEAQYRVALYFGQGDDPAAQGDVERYLKMAAAQGHPKACVTLGEQLLETDPAQAVRHLKNAADCGEPKAMELLGKCYSEGIGLPKNEDEALGWFEAAARRGTSEDKLRLALRFQFADGVPYSMGRAMSWVHKAQLAGMEDAEARFNAVCEEKERRRIQKENKRLEKERRKAEAAEALRQKQENGDRIWEAEMRQLPGISGLTKNGALSADWMNERRKLKERMKIKKCSFSIIRVKNKSVGVHKQEHHMPVLNQTEQKNADDCNKLFAEKIEKQITGEPQLQTLRNMAEAGNADAQWILGRFYFLGIETPAKKFKKEYQKAYRLLTKSATQGNANGQYWLGWVWAYGLGGKDVKKDLDKAEYWWLKAGSKGHKAALGALNNCVFSNETEKILDVRKWLFER